MATSSKTQFENVVTRNVEGQQNLKVYGELTENAELVWNPIPYKAFGKILRTTNREVATQIHQYYSKTFHDLRGVNLAYDPARAMFFTEMYFSKNMAKCPENKIENLKDLTVIQGDKHNLFYQKQVVDNKSLGKHYTINDQTKLLLADIMFGGRAQNMPEAKIWKQPNVISEFVVPASDVSYNPRAVELLVRVAGCFDFRRILQKLYGTKTVVETKVYRGDDGLQHSKNITVDAGYEARYIKPVPNEAFVFVMNIEQFDKAAVEDFNLRENPVRPIANGIVYYSSPNSY